jgi:hypothetical protein
VELLSAPADRVAILLPRHAPADQLAHPVVARIVRLVRDSAKAPGGASFCTALSSSTALALLTAHSIRRILELTNFFVARLRVVLLLILFFAYKRSALKRLGNAAAEDSDVFDEDAVVITGLGLVTSDWNRKDHVLERSDCGRERNPHHHSRSTPLHSALHRGGEVCDFHPEAYCRNIDHRRIGRGSQMAIAAARLAFDDGGIRTSNSDPSRTAVIFGTTMGESPIAESIDSMMAKTGGVNGASQHGTDSPLSFPQEMISSCVAREFGLRGPVSLMATACAAGN